MPATQDSADLRKRLEQEPYQFDFFQAVRLLRWLAETDDQTDVQHQRKPVGEDYSPQEEIVRFRALPSLSFPQGSISRFKWPATRDASPAEMIVGFMGLTGPNGVLPRHYTQLVMDRVRDKDYALRDYLDLFNHRVISHFYRAWTKYRLPLAIEQSSLDKERRGDDLFTRCLLCFIGLGTPGLRDRLQLNEASFLYYSGHFAHYPRNAISLEAIVADYFQLSVQVQQCRGQWLYLSAEDQSNVGQQQLLETRNNQLGINVVVGRRVWGVENNFRLRLGPLSYRQFAQFMPAGSALIKLAQLVRMYVGLEFDFDVQLILRRDEVPPCQLASGEGASARLGWNTWIRNRDFCRDVDDAVFVAEGNPDIV